MSLVHFRLAHYAVTLTLYVCTFYDVVARLAVTTKDPIVADFATLQGRFMTIWTFLLQMAYMFLGLTIELLTLNTTRPGWLLKSLSAVRELIFSSVLWPTTCMVTLMFWPMFLYDPGLVFPSFIDKILSPFNNQVLHTYILSAAVFELVCLGRRERNHRRNLAILTVYLLLYLYVFIGSYLERGTWIYPIFNTLMGTIYFPVMFVIPLVIIIATYFIQFPLTDLIWSVNKKSKKQKQ